MQPAAQLSILVTTQTNPAIRGLMRVQAQLGATEKASNKALGTLKTFGKVAAFGVGGALAYSVKKAADFESQLSSLGSVSGATAKQMDRLRQQAMKAGADTKFSALDAAKAQTELAKGGLSVQQVMKGGLKSALALAAAGELDLADAAATTANALNLFGLRGKASMKVADQLATAANATTADVSDFAVALQQGGSVAKTAGLNLSETVLALEALAKSGIKGSDAGTSLKTSLVQLLAPSAKQAELAKQLNLSFTDQEGKIKNLSAISDMLRDRLGGMTKAQRLATLATLAGTDGVRTLTALYDAGSPRLDKWRKGLQEQGTAAEVAAKKQDNLKGALENLQGSVETIAISIGSKLLPSLTHYARQLTDILNAKGLTGEQKLGRITELLASAVGRGIAEGGKAAIKAAPGVAKGFVNAFIAADIWGKLAIGGAGGFLLHKMGLTGGIGRLLLGKGGGQGKLGGGGLGSLLNKPVPVVVTNPGFGGPGGKGPGGKLGPGAAAGAGAAGGLLSKIPPALKAGGPFPALIAAIKITTDFMKDKSDLGLLDQFADDIERVAKAGDAPGLRQLADKMREVADANRDQTKGEHLRTFANQLDNMAVRGGKDLSGLIRLFRNLPTVTGSALPKVADHLSNASRATGRLGDQTKDTTGRVRNARGPMDSLKDAASRLAGQAGVATGKVDRLGNEVRNLPTKKRMQVLVDIGIQGLEAGKNLIGGGGSGDGWGISGAIDADVAAEVQKRDPLSLLGFTGIGGGSANLMGASSALAPFAALGAKFGLSVTSGLRPGAITNSGNPSLHGIGRAIDVNAGSAGQMMAYALAMAKLFGSRLAELIYTPMGFSIKNGVRTAPYAQADHYDHVHVAMQQGGMVVPGSGSGDKVHVQALLEPRERMFILNRNASDALGQLDTLNQAIPRFQKGGQVGWPRTPINITADAARRKGRLTSTALINMVAIAGRESGYNPKATNFTYPDHSIGLWQINQLAHKGRFGTDAQLMVPDVNAEAMGTLFGDQGYGPWVGVHYGNAASFLGKARAAVAATAKGAAGAIKKLGPKRRAFAKLREVDFPEQLGPSAKQLRRRVGLLTKSAEIAGDMAARAEQLGQQVGGRDQIGWLNDQLSHLFALRNTIIDVEALVETRRDAYTKAIEKARKRLHTIAEQIEKAAAARRTAVSKLAAERKRKQPNKKRIKELRETIDRIDRHQAGRVAERDALTKATIPGFEKDRKRLNTNRGTWLQRLEEVQGLGSPMARLSVLPPVGVLGGQIFDVQAALRDAAERITDTSTATADTSESVELLKQLLREANLRTAVSERQFDIFKTFDATSGAPFMGAFQKGGVALVGERGPELAHLPSGTRVHSATDTQQMLTPEVNVNVSFANGMEWLRDFVKVEVEHGARRIDGRNVRVSNRAPLPGSGGGGF